MEVSLAKIAYGEPEPQGEGVAAASGAVAYVPSTRPEDRLQSQGATIIGFRQDKGDEGLADPPAAGLREAPLS